MNNKVLPEIKAAEAQYEELKNLRTVCQTLLKSMNLFLPINSVIELMYFCKCQPAIFFHQ